MDNPEAPPKSAWRLPAVVMGCVLLAAAPAILSAVGQEIDSSLHIADVWPDFWTQLAQIEAWRFGGIVLGAALIAGRVLVNKLHKQSRTPWYLMAVAVWWLLLALAPLILARAILPFGLNPLLANPHLIPHAHTLPAPFAL